MNDQLLQGPNLTITSTGTLVRLRQEEIVIIGDIDSMFYKVRVPNQDARWWFIYLLVPHHQAMLATLQEGLKKNIEDVISRYRPFFFKECLC